VPEVLSPLMTMNLDDLEELHAATGLEARTEAIAQFGARIGASFDAVARFNDLVRIATPRPVYLSLSRMALPSLPRMHVPPIVPQISSWFKGISELGRLSRVLDDLAKRDEVAGEVLWSIGWVIDMEMPIRGIHEVAGLAKTRPSRAHAALASYYTGRLDEIESALTALHPERAPILAAAFRAHRRKEYVLSVPVLLAQCDGIAHDVLQAGLYAARGADLAAAIRRSPAGDYIKRLGANLEKQSPIHADESTLDPKVDPLNRHQVLHGRSASYGTRLKSLQAIALANFVGVILMEELEEAKARLLAWRTPTEGLLVTRKHFEGGKKSSRAIIGTVRNASTTLYSRVEVRAELLDNVGSVVERASAEVGPLGPGEERSFRLPFATPGVKRFDIVAVHGT